MYAVEGQVGDEPINPARQLISVVVGDGHRCCVLGCQVVPVGLVRTEEPLTFCQVVMIAILEPCEKEVDSVLDVVRTADDTVGVASELESVGMRAAFG